MGRHADLFLGGEKDFNVPFGSISCGEVRPQLTERMMPFIRLSLFCGMLLAVGPGCGLFFPREEQPSAAPPHQGNVVVEVESHNWSDITVYLLTGGLPQRLGMVSALGEASFDFPPQRLNSSTGVRLRALPVAGRPFTSDAILVLPGQVITWTLENNLDASSYSVY
jgi:hypothetical protein